MPERRALVTGAGRGLGAAIAAKLVTQGWFVLGVARSADQLASQAELLGPQFEPFPADLVNAQDIARVVHRANSCGGCSALVNNAGFGGPYVSVAETTDDQWLQVINVNLAAAFFLIRALLPPMVLAKFGRIVNIGSIFADAAAEGSGAYIASKHALLGLTRAVATENARYGITCNMVSPGFCRTEMTRGLENDPRLLARIPAGRLGEVDEVAGIVGMLLRPESAYVNGAAIAVDGGLKADLSPFPRV